ncbi:MAG: ABC transporter ATP-binding protein [Gammaproteobacteria bacterium]
MSTTAAAAGAPATESPIALSARGLNKHFGAVPAAQDLTVDVPRGEIWSLIGTNGAGKTTFVNIVTGYTKPDSGHIVFEGRDITRLSPRDITRLGVRRSFQIPQLCTELTVLENMLVSQSINAENRPSFYRRARRAPDVEKAMALLERFKLDSYRDSLIGELSGGVRKLLDIAMVLPGHPRVVLLDEPTSGVATEEKYPLMDLVMEALAAAAVTVLFVEHDMDIVTRYARRVLAFYDGRIIANDAPDEVLGDAQVQRYVTGTA